MKGKMTTIRDYILDMHMAKAVYINGVKASVKDIHSLSYNLRFGTDEIKAYQRNSFTNTIKVCT